MAAPPPPRAPGAGYRAPRLATSDAYAGVNLNAEPFPRHVKNYKTFEGWFNYFYTECPNVDRKRFYEKVLTPQGTLEPEYGPGRDDARRQVLTEMLAVGFEPFDNRYQGTADDLLAPVHDEMHFKLGFRGELRVPSQVKAHDGCVPRAQVPALRRQMGMDAAWHPFRDPSLRNKLYFRRGFNADNCLFTTVSVATDFMTASKFPLLADLTRDNPDAIDTAVVWSRGRASRVREMAAAREDRQAAAREAGERLLLQCVRMNVYLFTASRLWNTQKRQSDARAPEFPERAAAAIAWDFFVARVRCDRIHFGPDSNDGHLLVVDGYDWLHPLPHLHRMVGARQLTLVERFLNGIVRRGRLGANGGGGLRFETANTDPGFWIERVERIESRGNWL